ncbi:hypothetical protein NAT51_00095 [Flavobacterium amniphilum]|uniref:DUF6624 domain-containing protein n=1 Tax=Flavobacterium amniphilum TaxID=1834035 RepID=UPI002029F7FE|nr:DUF6624 domain-containing protein [Flavobacterium amniphilum]MCL9803903.1 hypothetical protein [Flavobacterium amniphilum]
MKARIASMYEEDQRCQRFDTDRIIKEGKKYTDSMNNEKNRIMEENTLIAKQYFTEKGYPGIKENGESISMKFWALVQHSDHDVDFQKKALKSMKKELRNKNVSIRNYAYLHDRVHKNKGKKQLYGTQVEWSTGRPLPYDLKYPEKVDTLRKEVGLEPLKEYLDSFMN